MKQKIKQTDIEKLIKTVETGTLDDVKKMIISTGIPIDIKNSKRINGLHAAIMADKFDIATWFWDNGLKEVSGLEPWYKLACEKYMDYFIKFDGIYKWSVVGLSNAIIKNEYKFVEWVIKNVTAENTAQKLSIEIAKVNEIATSIPYDVPFKIMKLCLDSIKDPSLNDNIIMLQAARNKKDIDPETYDYIMNNPKLIETAVTLGQVELLPKDAQDIFIF